MKTRPPGTTNRTPASGYPETPPDAQRGDDARDAFEPEFEQGRQTTEDRDQDNAPSYPRRTTKRPLHKH